ncbi:MAG: hypothetical protein APF82_04045 [Sphingomonadales bacterium BRH_c42]|nr:MAG: hypothetical protein APF82_04045 [Sphingomonadales bacterium BRH_c42]
MPEMAYVGNMNQANIRLALSALALFTPAAANAADGDGPAITPYADIRYRLELVDQDGLPEDATASTIRVRVGVKTDEFHGFSAVVEGEAIMRLGPRDFNDTVNGKIAFPVVADPSDVLLNQAYVKWRPDQAFEVTAGRQAVNLDNQRWIGSVGWRQNDQTLDVARVTLRPVKNASLDYLYAWRVNRVFGPDSPQGIWHDTEIHGARAGYAIPGLGAVSAYGYWLDIPAAPASSSQTIGARIVGEQALGKGLRLLYVGEYARQRDRAANPLNFALDYLMLEPGIAHGGLSVKAGYERLEGNGSAALQTPLATLHAFNGWADKFLVTPANGLRDLYLDAGYKIGGGPLKGLALRGMWHDFNSTLGSVNYGSEWDAQASYPLNKRVTALVKFAHYDASAFATDTTKAWFSIEAKF